MQRKTIDRAVLYYKVIFAFAERNEDTNLHFITSKTKHLS